MQQVTRAQALIATIAYADIFQYPLTRKELQTWFLLYPIRRVTIPKDVAIKDNFVLLSDDTRLIHSRKKKELWQKTKWAVAQKAVRFLKHIPTIDLIGVTGGLAMDNAEKEDDVDLFFIVRPGTIWISRLLVAILMEIIGLRRRARDTSVVDKICLNMFMDAGTLSLPISERDCFAAHEVLQMVPMWQRGSVYKKFLRDNHWVKYFLPNAWEEKIKMHNARMHNEKNILAFIAHCAFRLFEFPAKEIQLWYMSRHRTSEVISDSMLRFHPHDARIWVKKKWQKRLKKYGIPIDNVFYAS